MSADAKGDGNKRQYLNSPFKFKLISIANVHVTEMVENLHAHVNRNLQHANPNLHVL